MKKSIITLSTIVAISLLSGCQSSSSNNQEEIKPKVAKSDVEEQKFSTLSNSSYTLTTTATKQESNQVIYVSTLDNFANCDTSKFAIVKEPEHGEIILHDNGYYTYIADDGFSGSDSFTFTTNDGSNCDPYCVTIESDLQNSTKANSPTNLSLTRTNCDGVFRFSWDDNSDNEDAFVIYQDGKPIYIACANQTSQELTLKLDENQEYNFEISSMNAQGISQKSGIKFKLATDSDDIKPEVKIKSAKIIAEIKAEKDGWSINDSDIDLEKSILYFTDTSTGLISYDVIDTKNPVKISSKETDAATHIILTDDAKIAYVLKFHELIVLDVSDPADMKQIGRYGYSTDALDKIYLSEDEKFLYTTTEFNRIFLLDVSDPTNPTLISEGNDIEIPKTPMQELYPNGVVSKDQKTLFTPSQDDNKVLDIIDISDPDNPKTLTQLTLADSRWGEILDITLSKDESKLFISTATEGLKIVELYK
jgi:hypothetical protein